MVEGADSTNKLGKMQLKRRLIESCPAYYRDHLLQHPVAEEIGEYGGRGEDPLRRLDLDT